MNHRGMRPLDGEMSMRTICKWLSTVIASALLFANVGAQSSTALERSFAAAMRESAPGWQMGVLPVELQQTHIQRWRRGNQFVKVRHFVRESSEAAAKLIQQRIGALPVASTPILGIGEEAYLVADYGPTREAHIQFRVGTVVVEVSTIGEENARRFAAMFLAEVKKAVQRGPRDE